MGAAPRERLSVAFGLLSLSRTLGQTTGFPLMAVLFGVGAVAASSGEGLVPAAGGDIAHVPPLALVRGLHDTFVAAAGILVLAAYVSALAWRIDRGRRKEEATLAPGMPTSRASR